MGPHVAELHPLLDGVVLIIGPSLHVPQFSGPAEAGIVMTEP